MRFLLNWITTAIAVAVAVYLVPGITPLGSSDPWVTFALVGLFLGFVNALIKPIVTLISLPVTILSLGIFQLVVNALMLELASSLSIGLVGAGISIDGLGPAIVASIIISVISSVGRTVTAN